MVVCLLFPTDALAIRCCYSIGFLSVSCWLPFGLLSPLTLIRHVSFLLIWFIADTQMVSIHVYVGRRFYAVLCWLYTELVLMFQWVFRTFCTGMVLFSIGGMSVF